jgi:uncharacterized membrane protein YdjX (TVP38/TMEM64 family)
VDTPVGATVAIPAHPVRAPSEAGPRGLRAWIRRLGFTGPLAVAALILPPLGTIALIATAATTGPWLQQAGGPGILVYITAFAILAGLALLPTYAQCALGGFAFGITLGIPAAIAGFAGGAVIGYEIARMVSRDRVMEILSEKPKWLAVRNALVGHWTDPPSFWRTTGIVALLRVPPNSPFALTNLVMASVKVPRGAFILGTALGMIPRSSLAVVIGAGLQQMTREELDRAMPNWVWYVGIAVTVAVVVVVMKLANRAVERFTAAAASQQAMHQP